MIPDGDLSALQMAAQVRQGVRSAEATVRSALERISRLDPHLNALTTVFAERALKRGRRLDRAVAAGVDPGPLAGAPLIVKNLFDVEGATTLAGAGLRRSAPAAERDAFAVTQAERAGAILVGAANMDEFAYGFVTENAHFGTTLNPHDPSRIVGGSSGGSAAAVCAGLAPLSLGTDTNGSIRVPAALCGIFGLKPTFGRLSRGGVFPFVHSLDHVGPLARTVGDLAALYDALQQRDVDDPGQAQRDREPALEDLDETDVVRAGVLGGFFTEILQPDARAGVERVASALGAFPTEIAYAAEARAAAYCLTAAEGGALHLATLRARWAQFDPAVGERLMAGALAPAALPVLAQRFRRVFRDSMREAFSRFDVLIAPATPFSATPVGQASVDIEGRTVAIRATAGLYAQVFSFIGLPVVTVPVIDGLPVGVQLIGPPWSEARLLRLARRLEREGVCRPRLPSELPGCG